MIVFGKFIHFQEDNIAKEEKNDWVTQLLEIIIEY